MKQSIGYIALVVQKMQISALDRAATLWVLSAGISGFWCIRGLTPESNPLGEECWMTKPLARDSIYRGRKFQAETIELCVRWYITYRLSYRDLVAMMAERGITVSHTTVMRWVLRYVPEYERRWARFARPISPSWRMDETAVSVRGGRRYLYRAVDRDGKSVHSLLCNDRTVESAQEFFRSAVVRTDVCWPTKINLDGNAATHRGLRLLAEEDRRWHVVEIRARRYLNNVVEQDHRAIKQRCTSMLGLKSFRSAAITFAGVELAHRIRKRQYSFPLECPGQTLSLKEQWDRALACSNEPNVQRDDGSPSMHQNSMRARLATSARITRLGGRRSPHKISYGRSLYLLVMPQGGRYWRYNYRYRGRQKTLALGTYPDVPVGHAWSRHQAARELLANGIDPAIRRKELRRVA
jgi:transposase-like protein